MYQHFIPNSKTGSGGPSLCCCFKAHKPSMYDDDDVDDDDESKAEHIPKYQKRMLKQI